MKKIMIAVLGMGLVAAGVSGAYCWEIEFNNQIGTVDYEEKALDIKNDWDAFWYKAVLETNNCDKKDLEFESRTGLFFTPVETETWFVEGTKYQTNDMDFWGWDTNVDLGWALGESNMTLTPFAGYGYRNIRFKRTNFNVLNIITSREVVSEYYYIHYLEFGAGLDYAFDDKLSLLIRGSAGPVISNKAHNSVLGNITGDGGYIVGGETTLDYHLNDSLTFSFGAFAELQNLEGGTSGDVIWPDNKLKTIGGILGLKYKWGPGYEMYSKNREEEMDKYSRLARRDDGGYKQVSKAISYSVEKMPSSAAEYYSYVRRKVSESLFYPLNAPTGDVYVSFSVLADGTVRDIKMVNATGQPALEEVARQSIKNASPFPSFPQGLKQEEVKFYLPISFAEEI